MEPTAPNLAFPTSTHGPWLVVDPRVSRQDAERASKAYHWQFRASVLTINATTIWALVAYFAVIDPSQAWFMVALGLVTAIMYGTAFIVFVAKFWWARRKLLRQNHAFWLYPGPTRDFYVAQSTRITNYVVAHHQFALRRTLHRVVQEMQRLDTLMDHYDDTFGSSLDGPTYAEMQKSCQDAKAVALAEIDRYVEDAPASKDD